MNTIHKDEPPATNVQTGDVDERRSQSRIPSNTRSTVTCSSAAEALEGAILEDVSFGGVALRVTDVSRLTVGQIFDVAIGKQSMPVVIKYSVMLPGGDYRVGTEFIDPSLPEVCAVLEKFLES